MSTDMHPIPELDAKGYREFALTTGGILIVLFGLAIPYLFSLNFPTWPWIIGGVLGAWGLIAPTTLEPVYKGWMKFGGFMGAYIMTPIIMFIVFFGMFMPMGLVMRLFGKDGMNRKLDVSAETYRVPSHQAPAKNLERPF